MESTSKNFFETITNMQKQVVENFTEATEKFQKNLTNNNILDSDFFKKWYDSQMSFFTQANNQKNEQNPMNYFNEWLKNQMEFANNWMNNMPKDYTQVNEQMNKAYESNMNLFNNWMTTMNSTYAEMMKNFTPGDSKNTFEGVFNNAQNYMKMFEMWMPMMKSIQDKTFTTDMFKQMFNPQMFKGMMDNMFNMQPEYMKNMMDTFGKQAVSQMDSMTAEGKKAYNSMKNMMGLTTENNAFDTLNGMYNSYYTNLNNAIAPWMKIMTPGANKNQVEAMNEMSHQFNMYNMMNVKMQYMMYVTGLKAVEEMSENIYTRMKEGKDMSTFMSVYQEWLNVADKNFVALFETDEYSKMQAELNAYGMKLKRNIDLQMEKAMAHLPLVNRTEIDGLYQTIHDLKKKITDLEKALNNQAKANAKVEVKAETKNVKKTASKKA